MAKAIKSVSIFAVLFIFFLVVSEMSGIEAQDTECLEEYGGDVGFAFCAPRIWPTLCYQFCRLYKGAKGGKCVSEENVKCICDFCNDSPYVIKSIINKEM
ncbi:hypothetical protein AALP_AA4G224500 [Arabis alpina]|uniref:Knottins-like domain-containing protein n=1 Tax=Arabis alpina TaxID=50452 RepID=A0A087H4X8_ARAAL|nr:hypothetical protein AALP_AA4G224500 [Arabis alpina]